EAEGALEQLHPRGLVARLPAFDGVRIEPFREAAVRGAQVADHAGVVDRRIHFQPVADDAGVGEQAQAVGFAVAGDGVDVEAVVGAAEAVALAQDGFPAQARLVDLQHQALEQHRLVALREAVFVVVVGPVQRVPGCDVAIAAAHAGSLANGRAAAGPGLRPDSRLRDHARSPGTTGSPWKSPTSASPPSISPCSTSRAGRSPLPTATIRWSTCTGPAASCAGWRRRWRGRRPGTASRSRSRRTRASASATTRWCRRCRWACSATAAACRRWA